MRKIKFTAENPNLIKVDEIKDNIPAAQIVKLEEQSKKHYQQSYHPFATQQPQPQSQLLVGQSIQPAQFANTKKYEDLAELAQKNNNEILREIMGQNGLNGFQDLMNQMSNLDPNDILKLNFMQMNNQAQQPQPQPQPQHQYNNNVIGENEIFSQYAKLFQDCMPLSSNNLLNNTVVDKNRNEILHHFYNSYSNK